MKLSQSAFSLALLASFSLAALGDCGEVRGWEGSIDLPSYTLGEEDPNPPFPILNRNQVYPYTMLDDLTDHREVKTYRALFLENDYLKATILPDMGGRLYSLFDKVSKREVFYRNNVVKYGLVALRGAWISGGIEFNFPNGHTVVTVSPVASRLVINPDGSPTAVVGGMDWVTEMHWEVALTLRPRQARLEQSVTLFNPTPVENLYWYWANASVAATEDMQFIYPMREANPHSRVEIWTYPVWNGVDWSWYKNIRQPTSLFGLAVHRDYFGAYYHDSDYGVVHAADYRAVPGKKVWSWGVAGDGLLWTDLLTDHDGPYNEIQSGRYETQLNQEFMPTRRVESWTEYWYPVRGLGGGFVEATKELALNVRFVAASGPNPQRVELAINPTVEIPSAKITVLLDGKPLRQFGPIAFNAATTAKFDVAVESLGAAKKALSVAIEDGRSRSLLHWSAAEPVDGNPDFVSVAGVHRPELKPFDKMTAEEIYLRGVEQEKNGDAEASANTYGQALQRDPMFIPALLKLAWRDYRAANLDAAEAKIVLAERRNRTDPAVQFAAGVIYRAAGKFTRAQDAFWLSLQFAGSPAPALAQLGEIAIQQKSLDEAERLLRQSLSYNPEDALVLSDLAVALRLGKRSDEAAVVADEALLKMPLLPFALAEAWLNGQAGRPSQSLKKSGLHTLSARDTWRKILGPDVQNYLEVAAWYRALGDLSSSDTILQAAVADLPSDKLSPMVYFYLAANAWQDGQDGRAREFAGQASSAPHDKVFPQRLSDAPVLAEVVARIPRDSHARYFLGTFLFAHGRFEDAGIAWLAAKNEGLEGSVLERNLGVYAWRVRKDLGQAAACYEKAIQLAPGQYRLYADLDDIYAQIGDPSRRERLFAAAGAEVLKRDTIRARRALFLVEQRQFDQALEILSNHHFKPWEGGQIIREIFVLAHLEKGKHDLQTQNHSEAERSFRQGLDYPVNLGVGKPEKSDNAEIWYWLGVALAAENKTSEALQAWETAAEEGRAATGPSAVFAAAALQKLGRQVDAEKVLATTIDAANGREASAHAHFAAGMAERFRDHEPAARAEFRHALELDPLLWEARFELNRSPGTEK